MPNFNVNVPHDVERSIAVDKLKSFMVAAKEDSPVELKDVEENWDNDGNLQFAFSAMGFRVEGQLSTEGKEVVVNGKLPFAALPFRGALETQLKTKILEAIEA